MMQGRDSRVPDDTPVETQQRRQARGLVWLALAALGFAVGRAMWHGGVHSVFPQGWWRIW